MRDAHPRSRSPGLQLEGIEGSQWANLFVLLVEERKSY